jgi:hypothetical protein
MVVHRKATSQGIESIVTATPTPSLPSTPENAERSRSSGTGPEPRGHIGRVVALSLAVGLFAAVLLAFAPFISPEEDDVTGAVLCGFALGWATLTVLSTRFTDQPQRWAAAPAVFMGLGGLLLIGFGDSLRPALNWVWPPALLGLVIWTVIRARSQLHSRSRFWLLYPVFAVLAVAAVGGGYETIREHADTNAYR